jgi:hypothetical protein
MESLEGGHHQVDEGGQHQEEQAGAPVPDFGTKNFQIILEPKSHLHRKTTRSIIKRPLDVRVHTPLLVLGPWSDFLKNRFCSISSLMTMTCHLSFAAEIISMFFALDYTYPRSADASLLY